MDSITAFGLEAKDTSKFTDLLAAVSTNSNTNVAMMGETFKYVSPVAGSLGFTAKDTALGIGLMANAGIKASQSGTSLRSAFTKLVKPSDQGKKVIKELGISVTETNGKMKSLAKILPDLRKKFAKLTDSQKASKAAALFGTDAMSGMLAIINASEEDYNKLADAINNSSGAAKKMADMQQDTLAGSFEKLKSATKGLMIDIGEKLAPTIRKFADLLTTLPGEIEKVSVKLQPLKDLIIDVGKAFLNIFSDDTKRTFDDMVPVIDDFNGLIFRIFPQDVAEKISDRFYDIVSSVSNVIDHVKPIIMDISTWLTETFWPTVTEFWDNVEPYIAPIIDNLSTIIAGLADVFSYVLPFILELAGWFVSSVTGKITAIIEIFGGLTDFIAGVFTGDWGKAWKGVTEIFGGIWDGMVSIAKKPLNLIIGLIDAFIEDINRIKIPDWVPIFHGKSPNIPKIPKLAKGATNWGGGPAMIGETGEPEIVTGPKMTNLPKGSNVLGVNETKKILGGKNANSVNISKVEINVNGNGNNQETAEYVWNYFNRKLEEEILVGGRA